MSSAEQRQRGEAHPLRVRVVRWLGAYRRAEQGLTVAALWESHGFGPVSRERAAEPLWRGRSLLLQDFPLIGLGLAFSTEDVVRCWHADAWTEPARHGRLLATRGAKGVSSWDRFARAWARTMPLRHGEVAVRIGAEPIAVAHRAGSRTWAATARDLAVDLGLPTVAIRAVSDDERRADQ